MRQFLLAIAIALPFWSFGFSTPDYPLRRLVVESKYIVVAEVLAVEEAELGNTRAVLQIKEVLQGSVRENVIRVHYNSLWTCPLPPQYEDSTTVLAFLRRGDQGQYQTVGLSNGSKTLSLEVIELYKDLIKSLQTILKQPEGASQTQQLTDWFIDCIAQAATAEEGAREIIPYLEFGSQDTIYPFPLDEFQTEDLRKLVLGREEISFWDLQLIQLIEKENDPELLTFMKAQIRKSDTSNMVVSERLMLLIADRTEDPNLDSISEAYWTMRAPFPPGDWDHDLVREFIAELEENEKSSVEADQPSANSSSSLNMWLVLAGIAVLLFWWGFKSRIPRF